MRARLLETLVIVSLAAYGCGGGGSGSAPKTDARDGAPADRNDGPSADRRPDLAVEAGGDAAGDAATGGADGAVDGNGRDGAADAALDMVDARDAGADAAPDVRDAALDGRDGAGVDADAGRADAGGGDVAAPTCSDRIKNSDETDIDCGGHCGKCGADKACLVGTDCSFGICRADRTCGACGVAADCPGAESECQHRSCTVGVCGVSSDPAGTVLALQTSGDCKSRQCAGDGTVAVVNDNSDLPDDRNPCTNDFCMTGTPSHTMLPLNSSCGGLNRCTAAGQCVGCIAGTDCPGTDTVCQTRVCSAQGVCSFSFRGVGTVLNDPIVGDCKALQCDGAGNTQVVNANTDLPVDNNPCTSDECTAGTPSHRPLASGVACGAGLICDGANRCVACVSASTCPGTDTECHTRTCVNGTCGVSNTTGGTPTVAQVARDCKRIECNGAGATFTVPDITDLPVDNNPCTAHLCNGDTPANPNITAGTSCTGTSVCDGAGACVACLTAASCPGTDTECHTRTCSAAHLCGLNNALAGKPLALQTIGDCKKSQCDGNGNPQIVSDDTDVRIDGNVCTRDVCMNGTPSNPPVASGVACGTGLLCNATGSCVGCIGAADCPGSDTACQTRVCTAAGQCDISNALAGTVLPPASQMAGDCKRSQCDGMGNVASVADDTDKPVDGNTCTQDLCTLGVPSNPPEPPDTACAQGGGTRCNGIQGAAACVQCNTAAQCPGGPDTECRTRTCSAAGLCGVTLTQDGTAVSSQLDGDCKRNQCSAGNIVSVADPTDVLIDGNACTQDLCMGGAPSNPAQPLGTPCAVGGSVCNGASACVQCNQASDCPGGPDTECHVRVCTSGTCSIALATENTHVSAQTAHDCHVNVCNALGEIVAAPDDSDVFDDGKECTQNVCVDGAPENPPLARGTACGLTGASFCDAGTCVQCLDDSNCDHAGDTACMKNRCTAGSCVPRPEPINTPAGDPIAGDCHSDVCDGMGAVTSATNDSDLPIDGNDCTQDLCAEGMRSNPAVATGTVCAQNGGRRCDVGAACVPTFMVARLGDGTAMPLTNAATPVFVEERFESDGALVRVINIPSTGSTPKPLTLSGTADSEGALALSGDHHSVSLAGYSAIATTAGVGSTSSAAVPRAAALVFADGSVDTSTTYGPTAFTGNNVRSAVGNQGIGVWAAGNGTNPTRGVSFATLDAATSTVIESASGSTRVCEIVAAQLYCDAANGVQGIFAVGTGLPTATALIAALPGTIVDTAASYYAFVLLDMVGGDGLLDTLYVADDRATGPGGIQKWTLTSGTWSQVWTTNTAAGTLGVRGLTGYAAGNNVVLLATTASASPAPNAIIRLIDTGPAPTAASVTTLVPAASGVTVYRGIALAPQ
jgi:hypothetical protein